MNPNFVHYHRYYSSPDKYLTKTFYVQITGHLLADDEEIVLAQNLNIRASNSQEAGAIAGIIRDRRLNRLHTTTAVADIHRQMPLVWISEPGEPELNQSLESDIKTYVVVVIREAGAEPLTGVWLDYAEDHFEVHATSDQEAHKLADFISAIPFKGQVRRTVVNGVEHFDERW